MLRTHWGQRNSFPPPYPIPKRKKKQGPSWVHAERPIGLIIFQNHIWTMAINLWSLMPPI
jgi:hypothetical protein